MSIIDTILALKLFLVLGFMVSFMFAERLYPSAVCPFGVRANLVRVLKNLGLFGVNIVLSPLIILPMTVFAADLFSWREVLFGGWVTGWGVNGWGVIIFDILLLDFFIYWWHRFNHEIGFLWRFHRVHHLDGFLDFSTAGRFHFGEVIMSAVVRGVFIVLCDISFVAVLFGELLLLLSSIFQHSNLRLGGRFEYYLNWFIVSPAWHWVHHHCLREDTDSNYGNILTVWDRLFGSCSRHSRRLDMRLGIEGDFDRDFWSLLVLPFRRVRG